MTRVFVSYSHRDEQYRVELDKHLALLKREGMLDLWSDHCIRPSEEFDPAIAAALDASDLILLLISADFMHSDYCSTIEMTHAMDRHAAGSAIVVPIILRPCDWHSAPFGRLKALPQDGKPVTKWPTLDDAFLDIVQQLRNLLAEQARARAAAAPSRSSGSTVAPQAMPAPRMPRSSNLALPRRFTDADRHDFLAGTLAYVQGYFENSLKELEARNPGFTSRMTLLSPEAFKAVLFRDGKRVAGCYIRISAPYGGSGIAYSNSEAEANSYNEILSVEADKHMLFLKAGMAMFNRADKDARLTEEGPAEHLWTMFIGHVQ